MWSSGLGSPLPASRVPSAVRGSLAGFGLRSRRLAAPVLLSPSARSARFVSLSPVSARSPSARRRRGPPAVGLLWSLLASLGARRASPVAGFPSLGRCARPAAPAVAASRPSPLRRSRAMPSPIALLGAPFRRTCGGFPWRRVPRSLPCGAPRLARLASLGSVVAGRLPSALGCRPRSMCGGLSLPLRGLWLGCRLASRVCGLRRLEASALRFLLLAAAVAVVPLILSSSYLPTVFLLSNSYPL